MVAYHSSNMILVQLFKSRKDTHHLEACNIITQRLKDRVSLVYLRILDNECNKEDKKLTKKKWGVTYQLVPPHMHRRNTAERAIHTFKVHFLTILAGVSNDSPRHLWDLLLSQAELTLNLLWQSSSNPNVSAWEHSPIEHPTTPPHKWVPLASAPLSTPRLTSACCSNSVTKTVGAQVSHLCTTIIST